MRDTLKMIKIMSASLILSVASLLRTHCCWHKCFPVCPRAQHLLRTQILCPQQMFPSLRSPRNIMGNNVSATMCRRLPGSYDSAQANRIRSLSRVICILKIARPRLISKLTGNSKIKEKLCLHTEKSKLFDITLREMLPGKFHLKLYLHQLNLPTVPSTSTTCNQPRFLQCVYSTESV